MWRVLIIDDEEHMRDTLGKLLTKHCPDVKIIGTAVDVKGGISIIQELKPDIVLLDIQMKDGTGFDLLAAFPVIDFKIIFITAFDKYALQAFKFSAIDYIMKPVNPQLLVEAVLRAGQLIQDHFNLQVQALETHLKPFSNQNRKIIVKTSECIHLLDLNNIVCCESYNSYTTFHTSSGENIIVSKTLKDYDELLAGSGFYRVHKSHLINLMHIKRFDRQDGGYIVLSNELKIPVASRKRDEVLKLFEKLAE